MKIVKSKQERGVAALRRALMGAAAFGVLAIASSPASSETLADALVTAIGNNPSYDAAVAQLRGVDETVAQARAGQRPTITGRAFTGLAASGDPGGDNIDGTSANTGVSATIRQNLYDGGQTDNAVDEAFATVRSARNSLVQAEQTVLLNAVSAYVEVLRSQENVDLTSNNVSVIKQQLTAARDRFDVGEVTRTDVAQAEARLAEAQSNFVTAKGVLGQARQSYIRAVGGAPLELAPLPPLPDLPASLEEAESIAERNHPSIQASREAVEAASFNVREAQGGLLPTLDLVGDLSAQNDLTEEDTTLGVSGQLEAVVPIYQGGVLRSNIRQAQALAAQRRAELFDTARQIREQAGVAWENLLSSRARIESNKQQIRANEVAFEGVQEEAKVGSRTTLDVLDAEQELLDARVNLVNAESDEYVAGYELLSAIGLLTVSHLGLDAEVYNPGPNYQAAQNPESGFAESEDTEWRSNYRP
ncbi:MAG: TolC family outer membrane protein [Rhodobacteraceae bacterium]|nr:TolC family outer membrane protein [Paracoccaceae bacterium]